LGQPLVALDAAYAMLEIVAEHAPGAVRVQADLAALPFRRGCGASGWANRSYIHLPKADLPLALWDLHRVLAVGAPIELSFFEGDGEIRHHEDDLAMGGARRLFARWTEAQLLDVAHGAGFDQLEVEPFENARVLRGRRARTLADTVGPGLRLLLVGLNPSLHAADAGYGFAGPGNRFWPALSSAGIHHGTRDPWLLARTGGVGMTDLVKRATRRAEEVTPVDYRSGFERIERLAAWLQPASVCFVGLAGWRIAMGRKASTGWQDRLVGGRPAYVMPNPSGLNAHDNVATLAAHLRTAWAASTTDPDRVGPQ
jgi:double-stranded uracil-DNA glycosylase